MGRALEDLAGLEPGGVQLTPGNMPTPGFEERVRESGLAARTHHGWTPVAFKTRTIWNDDGSCAVGSDSVHPPKADAPAAATFLDWCESREAPPVLETMYPGHALADGASIEEAMRRRLWLAVD